MKKKILIIAAAAFTFFGSLVAGEPGFRHRHTACAWVDPNYGYDNRYYFYPNYCGTWRHYSYHNQPRWVYRNGCLWFIDEYGNVSLGSCF